MSEEIDVSKLKVPELRAELGRRGLNTFGTKQILMDRLNEALKTASPNSDKKQPADPEEQPHLASANLSRQPSQNSGRDVLDSSPKVSPQRGCENGLANEKDSSPGDQHQKPEQENLKRRRSPSHSPRRRSRSRDRDSRRSPRRRSRSPQVKSRMVPEPDNWEESASVFLDTYNCDLNLLIDATSSQAKPLTEGGFSLMWAGVRANYGSVSGRSFFEVRVVKNLPVENYDSLVGGATHVLRVGWSTEDTDFTLGEEPQSFGYGGTGKKSTNNKFTDYGCTFGEANFGIPRPVSEDPSSVFDEVIFTELGLDDAKVLVTQYNQEGQANRQPPEKRQRWDGGNRDRDDSRNSRFRGRDSRDRGRDMPRGRRDDFRSSPNRRNDDRGRRDYRGGYNASRDRSREGDRFDRNSDRESFGRQPSGRYGGGPPGGRFGPPNRGPFPSGMSGPGGFGGFDNSRGGMMRSGPARGGFPAPNFDSRAGRGAYRGSMDRGNPGYGGPNDTMYNRFDGNAGDAEPIGNAYDMNEVSLSQPPYEGGPMSGGFRGGYGGGGRGVQMQGSRGAPGRGGTSMGRGAIAPGRAANTDRGVDRSQLGRNAPVSGRGGAQPDRDMIGGFPDDSQQYNMYGGAEGYQNPAEEQYPGPPNDDYRNRRFGGPGPYNANALQKPSGGSYSAYQRGNPPFSGGPAGYPNAPGGGYNRGSLPSYGNPNSASNYPNSYTGDQGNFTNPSSDPYSGGMASDRSGRPGMQQNSGGPFGGSHAYGTSDPDKTAMSQNEHSSTDSSSLYASGAARYSDNHPSATNIPPGPRQSRFDTKPETNTTSQTSAYNSYALGSSYPGGFTSNGNQKATIQPSNPPGGPRSGRSRFDVGPPASQPIPPAAPVQSTTYNPPSQSVNRPQPQVQQTATSTQQAQPQSYGYGYSTQNAKPDGSSNQNAPPVSQSYGAYNYGYGYGTYGSQTAQPSATVSRCAPTTGTTQQSLYASAVADKPQLTQQTAAPAVSSATTTTATSDHSTPAAAAYASYYYGAPQSATGSTQGAGKYDAAMAAAQQFNAWQQQQQPSAVSGSVSSSVPSAPTATVTPTANPYASYYPGYSTYPSGYGTIPVGGAPPGGVPTAAAPPAMSQYYTGYR
ncbi:unnamed protein product [Schistosoma rodhaini]|uniref:Heterogeneous nuclear ribonucleoprotein U-like protein 1 n=1 Tax=Schistosoma rodhaini TaxID=6188 RepID=A0AA85EQI4_9TREM|nr:unnamed protein product [Schistosoma rodhaini]CAH8682149.1 unnamed protein product [Schistosoma rodhaini]